MARDSTDKSKTGLLKILIIASLCVIGGIFAMMFMLANTSWVTIYMPVLPWSNEANRAIFETKSSAIMTVSFFAGVAATIFFWRISFKETRAKSMEQRKNIEHIENELKKTERLVASSRDNR